MRNRRLRPDLLLTEARGGDLQHPMSAGVRIRPSAVIPEHSAHWRGALVVMGAGHGAIFLRRFEIFCGRVNKGRNAKGSRLAAWWATEVAADERAMIGARGSQDK